MSKDPAFLFYSNDFLTGTYLMSDEQVGKYIRLLCLQHQKLTLSEKDMMHICKTYDEDIFSKFAKDDSGYYNERLREESKKRKSYTESRKNNRKKKDMKNICSTYEEHMIPHMENENENEDIVNNTININYPKFSDFNGLPELKVNSAIELISLTKKKKVTFEQVSKLWEVFKVQNLDGKTYYPSTEKVYSHFINWIKNQNFQDAKPTTSESRYQARVDYANRHSNKSEENNIDFPML